MITEEQEKWLAHLSNVDLIKIIPFDPVCNEKFEVIKNKIQASLGSKVVVEHHGATSLGISGQDEVDIYVPVSPDEFQDRIDDLIKLFGEPKSHYPLQRARFVTTENKKHIDIFLINEIHPNWLNLVNFENHLRNHPAVLEAYKNLKEAGNGMNTREYYRIKTEFINGVLNS